MIGLVTATASGRRLADRLAASLAPVRSYPVGEIDRAWAECERLVCFLATGATVRLLARRLTDKHTDPGVVCVDEAGRYAVALIGGHAGGANALARRVSAVLGAEPVVTTASDVTGLTALDSLGWPVEGDVAAVTAALLDGRRVTLAADAIWPLPALPVVEVVVAELGAPCLVVTDRLVAPPRPAVVLRPPSLVVGVGASRGAPAAEVLELVRGALAEAGLAEASIRHLATVAAKADEPGIVAAAAELARPLVAQPADALAAVAVPHPSDVVRAAVGTPSVAEAAALLGGNADLVVAKRKSATATVAIARHRPRGRLAVVGLGPGARDLLTPRAAAELRRAGVIVGLDRYVEQIRDLLPPGAQVLVSGIGAEEERARAAVDHARAGRAVALVGSGDAGVYAMASPALELADGSFDVVGVPGVTAALAAAALLGAPLGHDHVAISLSDLHTPWEAIERRVSAAAEGDLVVTFYNPRSRGRDWQLAKALGILAGHRPTTTPVGVVTDASRPGEQVDLTTLADVDPARVGMTTVVVVGSSQTRTVAGRMVTPRGYRWG
ncbi:MAG TPA: precorrin-3B C(17)-methyltransferase [Mycobacteriales bacterium]|nr:precorrin-3B C(17)-methyltransferase [Mycobacteriales bacterium]